MNHKLSEGVFVEEIQSGILDVFKANQFGFEDGFVKFLPSEQVLPRCFIRVENEISSLPVMDDDVWISSFPKCGTTWTQEMVWNIVNNLDFQTAKSTSLEDRIPFLELSGLLEPWHKDNMEEKDHMSGTGLVNSIEQVKNLPSPRLIKTHLAIEMLPRQVMEKKVKVIYVTRNPRDAVVSFYNHWRILENFTGSFEVFLSAFLADVCGYYTPFIQHVLDYWKRKEDLKMLFLTYEEMKADLPKVTFLQYFHFY